MQAASQKRAREPSSRDPYVINLTQPLLGARRSRWLYPIASVEQTGALLVFGSDWPVTLMNPLEILPMAITRRDNSAGPGPAWIPEERIVLAPALAAYIIWRAYLSFRDRETGSIEGGEGCRPGRPRSESLRSGRSEIHRVKVRFTLVEGEVVHHEDELAGASR